MTISTPWLTGNQEPERAKRVRAITTSMLLSPALSANRRIPSSAIKFIDDQILAYQKKLEEAEERLKEFKLKNIALQTADGKDYFGRGTRLAPRLACQLGPAGS